MINRKKYQYLLAFVIIVFVVSCIKPPNFPVEPNITFKLMSTNSVNEFADSIVVTFEYEDGDGDLGVTADDTTTDVFFMDSRTGFIYEYRLPYIEPKSKNKGISGEITITILSVGCLPSKSNDTLHYKIQIKDRAGNLSNKIKTPDIYIKCN